MALLGRVLTKNGSTIQESVKLIQFAGFTEKLEKDLILPEPSEWAANLHTSNPLLLHDLSRRISWFSDFILENTKQLYVLLGVSGCGKTRALYEILSQEFGIYFCAQSIDEFTMMSDLHSRLTTTKLESYMTGVERAKAAEMCMRQLINCRCFILEHLRKSLGSKLTPQLWLFMQLNPRVFFGRDIFLELSQIATMVPDAVSPPRFFVLDGAQNFCGTQTYGHFPSYKDLQKQPEEFSLIPILSPRASSTPTSAGAPSPLSPHPHTNRSVITYLTTAALSVFRSVVISGTNFEIADQLPFDAHTMLASRLPESLRAPTPKADERPSLSQWASVPGGKASSGGSTPMTSPSNLFEIQNQKRKAPSIDIPLSGETTPNGHGHTRGDSNLSGHGHVAPSPILVTPTIHESPGPLIQDAVGAGVESSASAQNPGLVAKRSFRLPRQATFGERRVEDCTVVLADFPKTETTDDIRSYVESILRADVCRTIYEPDYKTILKYVKGRRRLLAEFTEILRRQEAEGIDMTKAISTFLLHHRSGSRGTWSVMAMYSRALKEPLRQQVLIHAIAAAKGRQTPIQLPEQKKLVEIGIVSVEYDLEGTALVGDILEPIFLYFLPDSLSLWRDSFPAVFEHPQLKISEGIQFVQDSIVLPKLLNFLSTHPFGKHPLVVAASYKSRFNLPEWCKYLRLATAATPAVVFESAENPSAIFLKNKTANLVLLPTKFGQSDGLVIGKSDFDDKSKRRLVVLHDSVISRGTLHNTPLVDRIVASTSPANFYRRHATPTGDLMDEPSHTAFQTVLESDYGKGCLRVHVTYPFALTGPTVRVEGEDVLLFLSGKEFLLENDTSTLDMLRRIEIPCSCRGGCMAKNCTCRRRDRECFAGCHKAPPDLCTKPPEILDHVAAVFSAVVQPFSSLFS